jgi:hypothetical protein
MDGNEQPQIATRESARRWSNKRRYKPHDWFGVGRVILQSPMAKEWIRIDSARTRCQVAALRGDQKAHEKATEDFMLAVCFGLVLEATEDRNHFFTDCPEDREFILSLDGAITDDLVRAAMEHCGTQAIDLEALQKN